MPAGGLIFGLAALPNATHLGSYSYRVRRSANLALLEDNARVAGLVATSLAIG